MTVWRGRSTCGLGLGPFARSKRLRMVRTELVEPSSAVFERRETLMLATIRTGCSAPR